jgi:hypothetical protein
MVICDRVAQLEDATHYFRSTYLRQLLFVHIKASPIAYCFLGCVNSDLVCIVAHGDNPKSGAGVCRLKVICANLVNAAAQTTPKFRVVVDYCKGYARKNAVERFDCVVYCELVKA